MTLEFKKFIINNIKKQMSIQHYNANVQIFKRDELPEQVKTKLQADFGNNYLLDADYLLFFSKNDKITKDEIEKSIFKVVNAALGESANNSTPSDFKLFSFDGSKSNDTEKSEDNAPTETTDDVNSVTDNSADEINTQAIADVIQDDDIESQSTDKLDESLEEPTAGERFVFVKITMK